MACRNRQFIVFVTGTNLQQLVGLRIGLRMELIERDCRVGYEHNI